MSGTDTTYTAWDGAERPWPPPENWYRAADGRWWHPAHGPNEPVGEEPETLPVWAFTDRTLDDIEDAVGPGGPTLDTQSDLALDLQREPEFRPTDRSEPRSDTPPESRRLNLWVRVALVAVAVVGVAGTAQFFLGGRDSEDAITSNDELAGAGTEEATGDAAPSDAAPSDADQLTDDDLPSGSSTESESSGDAALPGASAEAYSMAADPAVAATIAEFRRRLAEQDLATDKLTDDQITTFASTYCVFASGAEDMAAFDELRQLAVTTSRSSLTPLQLNTTINTAITVFCPTEADRLGITNVTSP